MTTIRSLSLYIKAMHFSVFLITEYFKLDSLVNAGMVPVTIIASHLYWLLKMFTYLYLLTVFICNVDHTMWLPSLSANTKCYLYNQCHSCHTCYEFILNLFSCTHNSHNTELHLNCHYFLKKSSSKWHWTFSSFKTTNDIKFRERIPK